MQHLLSSSRLFRYGGSISAILIRTPGTPHAAAIMINGHPLAEKGILSGYLELFTISETLLKANMKIGVGKDKYFY